MIVSPLEKLIVPLFRSSSPTLVTVPVTVAVPLVMRGQQIAASSAEAVRKLRLAMLVHGVDLNARASGVLSSVHGDDDVAQTIDALEGAIGMLKDDGDV